MTIVDSGKLPPVNWMKGGYSALLTTARDAPLSRDWSQWLAVLRAASRGEFGTLPGLFDLAESSESPVLVQSCYYLLGDAGGASIGTKLAALARTTEDFELMIECSDALSARGWLADVPLLLDLFLRNVDDSEAGIFSVLLDDVLKLGAEDFPTPSSDVQTLSAFRAAVMARYDVLVKQFGTADAAVFMGQRYSVRRMAEWLFSRLQKPHFRVYWTRRFEAATGVDCAQFYLKGAFQPLTAAAVIEEFLESPASDRFEENSRYFFGHRIPD